MVAMIIMLLILLTGCSSSNSVNRAFIKSAYVFSINEDALPIMQKMETIQKEASGGEEVEEVYVMSLYVKADKNKNDKISRGEAEKAYKQYLTEIRTVVGAIPFQVPTPK